MTSDHRVAGSSPAGCKFLYVNYLQRELFLQNSAFWLPLRDFAEAAGCFGLELPELLFGVPHQQSRFRGLPGLFDGQRRGHEFSDILAEPALSIEQTHFLKVCPGNKWHETNTISRDCDDKLADDRHATSAFNSRDDAQYVSAFLNDD